MINPDTPQIQQMSNHPPHIMIEDQQAVSPSSFIPFCSFGGNLSVMGKRIDKLSIPVCDKFQPTLLDGQRCYQVDVNELRNKVDKKKMASQGIELLLDYNFDRMVRLAGEEGSTLEILEENYPTKNAAMIYIETLGNNNFWKLVIFKINI